MEKNFLKDVIPPAHQKSVRDIPLPAKKGGSRRRPSDPSLRKASSHVPKRSRRIPEGHFARKRSKAPFYIILAVVLIVGFWIYGVFAHSATITLQTEEIRAGQLDGAFTIYNQLSPPETIPQAYIPYSLQTLSSETSQEVQASGQEEVEEFATGTIRVTKTTSGTQPLIKNTRFESTDGRIYRVRHSITVPGNGQKDIEVFADEPGDRFNLASGSFTIPGLKDLPEYDEITAETVTSISGGFSGVRNVVSEQDEDKTRAALQQKLESDLIAQIGDTISSDKVFYYTPSFIKYISSPSEATGTNVILREKGILQGLLFEKSDITQALVQASVVGSSDLDSITIDNIDALSITLEEKETFDPEAAETGSLLISGTPDYSWGISQESLGEQIAGMSQEDAEGKLLGQTGVQKFTVDIVPFWKSALPKDIQDINVAFQD